ncbi:MAG: PAS domain S-box protein [Anaerolineae bacterium]
MFEPQLEVPEDYRMMVERSPDLISKLTTGGIVLYASPMCAELVGHLPQDLVGHSIFEFVHQMDQPRLKSAFSGLMRSSTQTVHYRIRHKDGSYVWMESICKGVVNGGTKPKEVLVFSRDITRAKQFEGALQILARWGDQIAQDDDYFRQMVSHITSALNVSYAFITETNPDKNKVRMLAFWKGSDFGVPFEYALADTPCDTVINGARTCYYPVGVQSIFPKDQDLVSLKAQGYIGLPVFDSYGAVIGHLAVLDNEPLKLDDPKQWLLKIFAVQVGLALERMKRNKTRSQ